MTLANFDADFVGKKRYSRHAMTLLPQLPDQDRVSTYRVLLLATLLLVAAGAMLPIDLHVARGAAGGCLPGDIRRLLTWSEVFAHGLGVALIAGACVVLDPPRRRYWPRVLVTAYSAGLMADGVKLLMARQRPSAYLAQTFDEQHVLEALGTFRGWMPSHWGELWEAGSAHSLQSFPSAHTATAVGLACGLWSVYPSARWLLVPLAVLAAAQRIDAGAHYPSDVLAGAALGCLSGALFCSRRQPSRSRGR